MSQYRIIETPTPVNESAIRGKFLREHINDKAGCCGAKELLKLYSYRCVRFLLTAIIRFHYFLINRLSMTQFDWVVHVDVDVMFLQVDVSRHSLRWNSLNYLKYNCFAGAGQNISPRELFHNLHNRPQHGWLES